MKLRPGLYVMDQRGRTWNTSPRCTMAESSSSSLQSCTVFALTETARKGCCRKGSIFAGVA